ncbi:type I-C CRISPR-associated protein Cas8c/Csd1 [Paenibacillus massiliensis]|uniref:type I-C CRISPR-associated protein Cas8c/Csd1 n=1 Tax=Paenibacillus massiliensis TaxID=225917 RepID=UPI00035E8F4B|nr:type I-C CRISPR-associated protein Cas8c/Csd1 [Paenibacillus massiliensis]
MTWLANLSKTYDDHEQSVGKFELKKDGREYALIPVSHTTQTAHIEIHLDIDGQFLRARVIPKEEGSTIIPCTEAAASRTSAPVPYPLFDKLLYVAGDYAQYCAEPKGTPHQDYLNQLKSWCDSSYGNRKIRSVYEYVRKGTLIADLVSREILWTDSRDKLLDKSTPELDQRPEGKPAIFNVIAGEQSGAFVRFAVQVPEESEHRLWRDKEVQQSFVRFYASMMMDTDVCYVSGKREPVADKHASRIRHSGDKSKLISANDSSGFTYRGRFRTSREAATVSYEVSQKGHNALKWLIERQGTTKDGKVFLVWGSKQLELPEPQEDTYDLFAAHAVEPEAIGDTTHKEYARQVQKALSSLRHDLEYAALAEVNIMILDAATPGRMSIMYYRNMEQNKYIDQLEHWHTTCYWRHRYRKDPEKNTSYSSFIGAPAPRDIAFAAYGPRASDKVVKGLMERLLPCIVDRRDLPRDIVRSAIQRASNPVGMEEWDWQKTLSIACALVNKHYSKEEYGLSLNTETTDRSYVFGRMLAIADVLERRALGKEEKRASNAIRYMNAFAQHPGRTWSIIQSNLQPYQARLGKDAKDLNKLLDEVGSRLKLEDYSDKPLSGLYLLGFYSQRHDLYTSKKAKDAGESAGAGSEKDSDQESNQN